MLWRVRDIFHTVGEIDVLIGADGKIGLLFSKNQQQKNQGQCYK
jgi:hypothetical protein